MFAAWIFRMRPARFWSLLATTRIWAAKSAGGRFWLFHPDRFQDHFNIPSCHLVHRQIADLGKDIVAQGVNPLSRVFGVSPSWRKLTMAFGGTSSERFEEFFRFDDLQAPRVLPPVRCPAHVAGVAAAGGPCFPTCPRIGG